MENKSEQNKPDLFGMLAHWASLLPKDGEINPTGITDLTKVGSEIQNLCSLFEKNGASYLTAQPNKETSESVTSKTDKDFKPPFIFQLSTDETINPTQSQFDCVYDFCQKLEEYCHDSTKHNLNIEKDWLKLLLACSPHNYERFMWIHLTFQAANNFKFGWQQVKKRLVNKFDNPNRHPTVVNQLVSFRFIPELESIDSANQKFARLADEAQVVNAIDYYLNGLSTDIRDVINSTISYDNITTFNCTLEDIQQRASVLLQAKEGDFIFYSKTAHVALRLEHEKVNKKDCEFHILADHTTSTCPDYVIVRYPYMAFTPLSSVPKLTNESVSSLPLVGMPLVMNGSTGQQSAPNRSVASRNSPAPLTLPITVQHILASQAPAVPQLMTSSSPALPSPITQSSYIITESVVQSAPSRQAKVKQEQESEASSAIAGDMTTRFISEAIAAAEQAKKAEDEISIMTNLQVVERAKQLSEAGQPIPDALRFRVLEMKQQMLRQNIPSPSPPVAKKGRSLSPVLRKSAHRSSSPTASRYKGSSSRRRSPSPHKRRHHRDRSRSDDVSRSRSRSSDEAGCYIHGPGATHTTKECRQAQMVIPSRRSERRSASPPARSSRARASGRSSREDPEENICIFCQLPFKPGHLGYCKKVRNRNPITRNPITRNTTVTATTATTKRR